MQDLLETLLVALLDAATDALAEPNTEAGAPARRFVSHGEPAADCGQLTVHADPIRVLGQQGIPCAAIPVVPMVVTLHRCVTGVEGGQRPRAPSVETLDAEARALAVDGWALLKGLLAARRAGTLFEGIPCASVAVGPLTPVAPLGGIAGWRLMVEVTGPSKLPTS